MTIEDIADKKVLILGLGREGESTYRLFRRLWPEQRLALADQNDLSQLGGFWSEVARQDKQAEFILGSDYLDAVNDYQVVVRSPGIPLKKIKLKQATITSQTELFLQKVRNRTIGISGTKGKSTTAGLVHHLLQSKKKVFLVGNMGRPALDFWSEADDPNAWFVYEMSSHQLDGLTISPHRAVFLNLMPDHLDYFGQLDAYYQAKINLIRYQTPKDLLIYNQADDRVREASSLSLAKKIPFSLRPAEGSVCFWQESQLYYQAPGEEPEAVLSKEKLNQLHPAVKANIMPAVILAKMAGLNSQEMSDKLLDFKPPKHRLEFVGQRQGIFFYDDSAATIPAATISALRSLEHSVDTLIIGGSDKGIDFEELAEEIIRAGVSHLISFPKTGPEIVALVKKQALKKGQPAPSVQEVQDMAEAVKYALEVTAPQKACLLSPASASFTNFKNYQARGEAFQKWVQEMSRH